MFFQVGHGAICGEMIQFDERVNIFQNGLKALLSDDIETCRAKKRGEKFTPKKRHCFAVGLNFVAKTWGEKCKFNQRICYILP